MNLFVVVLFFVILKIKMTNISLDTKQNCWHQARLERSREISILNAHSSQLEIYLMKIAS